MQVTGTFPELSAGHKRSAKPAKATPKRGAKEEPGFGGFSIGGRMKKAAPALPRTFAGRKAASHRKAYGDC